MCAVCGYDLRGLNGLACPECGKPVGNAVSRLYPAEKYFLGGVALCVAAAVAWVVAIVTMASDPLWVIALWVPGAMVVVAWVQVSIWAAVYSCLKRKRRAWAVVNAVVSWGLGAVYVVLLMVVIIAETGR